jgi:hypothetical protein
MDQPEMNQTKQTDETDTVAAPVGRVGGRRPSTLSIGDGTPGGAPETGPLGPGQRWSLARKRAIVLRLLRGEAPELVSREIGVPVYKLERWAHAGPFGPQEVAVMADTGGLSISFWTAAGRWAASPASSSCRASSSSSSCSISRESFSDDWPNCMRFTPHKAAKTGRLRSKRGHGRFLREGPTWQ